MSDVLQKTCLLCGETSLAFMATCPNDGEASWSEPEKVDMLEVAPDPAPPVEEPAVAEPEPEETPEPVTSASQAPTPKIIKTKGKSK